MKLVDKDELEAFLNELTEKLEDSDFDRGYLCAIDTIFGCYLNTLEVKEVNEVPATVMVNKYGNRFISSWSGLKEYDDLKEGEEIKILIPKK